MANKNPRIARRMADIQSFRVMDLLARARKLEAEGRDIVHMEIGEPDFVTADTIVQAGIKALQDGKTHYTPAIGLPELRQAVSHHYRNDHDVTVSPDEVIITPGASGALQLLLGVIVNPGDRVIVSDPGYPCNRNFVRLFEGQVVSIPVEPENDFRITPGLLDQYWDEQTAAVIIANPANPTGTGYTRAQLQALYEYVSSKGAYLVVDEIYQGLVYDDQFAFSARSVADDIIIVNSFSKYYGMTGWRVGWLVAPESLIEPMDRLAQNIFLAAPTLGQHAAVSAFTEGSGKVLEARRRAFSERRDFLFEAIQKIGFRLYQKPVGAFYLYANCSQFSTNSLEFCDRLLNEAGVAITPGLDFGTYKAESHVRFAYTTSLEKLEEGVSRIGGWIKSQ